MSKRFFILFIILGVVALTTSACSFSLTSPKKTTPTSVKTPLKSATIISTTTPAIIYNNKIEKFKNYSKLAEFLNNHRPLTSSFSTSSSLALDSHRNVPNNYLRAWPETTKLVAGSANTIQSNGNYVYALVRNELFIINTSPASAAKIVSKIIFKSHPQAMILSGNFLAIYGQDTQISQQAIYQNFRRQNIYTFLKIFDLSNPAQPKETRNLSFEGHYLKARLIGHNLYFITRIPVSYLPSEPLLPRILNNGQILSNDCVDLANCFTPTIYYFNIPYSSYNFTSVTTINMLDNTQALSGEVYLANNQQKFYLSSNGLYITYSQFPNYYRLEQQAKQKLLYSKLGSKIQTEINKITLSPQFLLTNNEKRLKITQILDNYLASLGDASQKTWQKLITSITQQKFIQTFKSQDKTFLYKFIIKNDQLTYQNSAEVRGTIFAQAALNQSGDYLRLVTNSNPLALNLNKKGDNYYTNVYVLDSQLKIVGSLQNLMTTQKIINVSFLGNRLYFITSKSQDPLFVISLANFHQPVVLGAIQIPGTDNYLQALDANGTKFAVLSRQGEVSYSDGTSAKGLTWSLFDFSNLNKPQELSSYLISKATGNSIAFQDHQALLYSPTRNLLVLPFNQHNQNNNLSFIGSFVFNVASNKISLQTKIKHFVPGQFSPQDSWNGINYYHNTVQRSLIVGDNLITLSNEFLKINNLTNFKSLATIKLATLNNNYFFIPVESSASSSTSTLNLLNKNSPSSPLTTPGSSNSTSSASSSPAAVPLVPSRISNPAATSSSSAASNTQP